MTETPLVIEGQHVDKLTRLGFDGNTSQWAITLEDGTCLVATGRQLGEWINPGRPQSLLAALVGVGFTSFISVLALGIAWATRTGLI